jgi:hypothetical protein
MRRRGRCDAGGPFSPLVGFIFAFTSFGIIVGGGVVLLADWVKRVFCIHRRIGDGSNNRLPLLEQPLLCIEALGSLIERPFPLVERHFHRL